MPITYDLNENLVFTAGPDLLHDGTRTLDEAGIQYMLGALSTKWESEDLLRVINAAHAHEQRRHR